MEMLNELVGLRSIFGEEGKIGRYLANALEKRGFTVSKQEIEPGRSNILGIREGNKKAIGFYGHMDTVPVQGEWKGDPFKLRRKGDRLIGLGAYDMKAGIASILEAAEESGDCEVRIAFGVDEENNSKGAFSISGFFKGCDLILVPEINDSDIQREGTVLLGRRGRSVYDLVVRGKSCHAASGEGVNAINEAAKLVRHLDSMPQIMDPILGKSSQFISSIEAKAESLSYPEECRLVLDRHLVGNETTESALSSLEKEIKRKGIDSEISIKPREMPYLEPYSVSKENPSVVKAARILSGVYGELNYSSGKSVADECILVNDAPVLSFGPLGGNAHNGEEWVYEGSIRRLVNAYRRLIRSW